MQPQISIIVPVYKAEAYLHRCIDSLLNQTFIEFEILLIDDGSPDKSGEICDEYAKKDNRIRVFHKENEGVSSARQCGIDNALGEYTIHTDPDDWVEPNMLEELYNKAKEVDADMVICDFYEEYINKQIYKKQEPSALDSNTVLKELFQHLHGSCWNKLIKRTCYNKYNVKFPFELKCNEDQYVCASILLHEINIVYLPKAFYHYSQEVNLNSLVKKPKDYEERLFVKTMFCSLLHNHKHYNICYQFMISDMVCNVYYNQKYTSYEFKNLFYRYKYIILTNKNMPFHLRFRLYLSCIGLYSPIINFQQFLHKIRL